MPEEQNVKDQKNEEKKWTLHVGCHRKTLASRDREALKLDSLEACRELFKEREAFLASGGYFVWFAYATGPNEENVELHKGTSCY